MNPRWIEIMMGPILVLLAIFLISPAYSDALEMGVSADLAIAAYIGGLLVGHIFMLPYVMLARRSDRRRMKEYNEISAESEPSKEAWPSKRLILAFVLIVAIVFLIWPVCVYAPGAKALFIPMVYWVGIALGASLTGVVFLWDIGLWHRGENEVKGDAG